jgi:peptidoglycan/xylan/chitin deacetylase (PgdA/CDA1 family)
MGDVLFMKKNKGFKLKIILIMITVMIVYMRSTELSRETKQVQTDKPIEISYKVETNKKADNIKSETDNQLKISSDSITGGELDINYAAKNNDKPLETDKNPEVDAAHGAEDAKDQTNKNNEEKENTEEKPDITTEDKAKSEEDKNKVSEKVAYLTFDDGPTRTVTPKVLDILKQEDIKATFFVIGYMAEKNSELLKREKSEGHAIANHSYTHAYAQIYSNSNNFLEDMKRSDIAIKSVVGEYNDKLIRFPGGSFKRKTYIEAATEQGYHYVDWNCSSGDATGKKLDAAAIVNNVIETAKGKNKLIILMHDSAGKDTTAEALPEVILYLKQQGYTFKTLE